MNPRILASIKKGHEKALKERDYMNWINGQYQLSALVTALDGAMNGKKAKKEYFKKPIFELISEELKKGEKESDEEFEMRREIAKMEKWIANDRKRGLPETKIL